MALNRSSLVTPGSEPDMIRKATDLDADKLIIDLEDAVAPSKKSQARSNIVAAATEYDFPDTRLSVRVNELSSRYVYDDIRAVVEGAGEYIDTVVVPKVRRPKDIYAVDSFLATVEETASIDRSIGIEILVEDVRAFYNMHEFGSQSARVQSLVFGSHDYAVSVRGSIPVANIGSSVSQYSDSFWEYLQLSVVQAANYSGVEAINTIGDDNFSDIERFREDCERGKALGFTGGWAVHPAQIEILNDVFSPRPADVEYAETVVEAFERSEREKERTAFNLDGTMVTRAHYQNARKILNFAADANGSGAQ